MLNASSFALQDSTEEDDEARSKAAIAANTTLTEEELLEFKKMYSAPDSPGKNASKLLKLTGEKMLASEKAKKILGGVG